MYCSNSQGLQPKDYAVTDLMIEALLLSSCSDNLIPTSEPTEEAPVTISVVLLGVGLKMQEKELLNTCAELLNGKVVGKFTQEGW